MMDEEIEFDIFIESREGEQLFEQLQSFIKQSFAVGYQTGKFSNGILAE